MNNYRVTYAHDFKPNYWTEFMECTRYVHSISWILNNILKKRNISVSWWFFEPYVEITWIDEDGSKYEEIRDEIKLFLETAGIHDAKFYTPADGNFGDWYCESEEERDFGAFRHALSARFALLCFHYQREIQQGKGIRRQVARTIHTICNPLALNYREEAKICLSRGLLCLLFCFLPFKVAVWIYTKVFRQEY